MKYSKKRVKHICELISKDTYTVVEICSLSGISVDTYYEWLKNKPEFSDAVAQARAQFDEMLVKEAKNSLRKLVNGYDAEEKKTVYVNQTIKDDSGKEKQVPRIKEQTTILKHYQPNAGAVEYVLNNKASEEFKNRQTNEVTGKDGAPLFPDIMVEVIDKREQVENTDDKDLQPG